MPVEVFLKIIDRLPDALMLVSAGGIVLGANRRLGRFGIGPDALRGQPLCRFTTQPAEAVAAYLRRCSRTAEPLPGTLTLRGVDGTEHPCRSAGSVLAPAAGASPAVILLRLESKDASISRFLALNRKIDELGREVLKRQKVEQELREQKEWLGVTLSSIGDAVIATDTASRVIFMNPAAESLTGWTQREASGRDLPEVFRIINEETREEVEDPASRCLREGRVVGLANHTLLIAKDGTEHSIDDTAAPIREPGGKVKGSVLVFHDVEERRRLERELRRRAEQLVENDRRKDEFLAMLAHELRNPLASINNAAQLFGKLDSEDELAWAKDAVLRQVRHLARLIDDLLDVSRITRGKIVLRRQPLDLSPVVGSAVEAVRPLLDDRKHELEVAIAGPLRLEADPLRIEQVLVNLLTNAAKYTDSGGRIRLAARHEGGSVVITIDDTGVGIPPDLLPRIFDLFTQGDRSIARSEGGLGIGLTLVQTLVAMHDGEVAVSSPGAGKGSTFTVRLPALEGHAERPPDPGGPPLPQLARQGARVLVVDDNVDSARGLARLLKLLGHDVRVAYDGTAAFEAARLHRPEIVLLDIGLPGMDGYQVVKWLRSEEACATALIIAVSGYGQPEDLRRSREAGFDHHLVKPVDYEALVALFAPDPS